jgi:deazaflavin-dependent oxidoreductase (nitroreductase family)
MVGEALDRSSRTPSALQRLVRWFAGTRLGAWVLARTIRHIDAFLLRSSAGRLTFTSIAAGVPVIELTTVGARTGRPRSAVVLGIPLADGLAVVAGDFGRPRPPAWMHNLLAHPEARARIGGRRVDVTARLLAGEERAAALDAALAAYPPYATYATWLRDREIAVFALEPRR